MTGRFTSFWDKGKLESIACREESVCMQNYLCSGCKDGGAMKIIDLVRTHESICKTCIMLTNGWIRQVRGFVEGRAYQEYARGIFTWIIAMVIAIWLGLFVDGKVLSKLLVVGIIRIIIILISIISVIIIRKNIKRIKIRHFFSKEHPKWYFSQPAKHTTMMVSYPHHHVGQGLLFLVQNIMKWGEPKEVMDQVRCHFIWWKFWPINFIGLQT